MGALAKRSEAATDYTVSEVVNNDGLDKKGAAGAAHGRDVSTRAGECGFFLMLPLHWQRLLSVFEPGEQSDFPSSPKHNTSVSGFFFSLLRIFSISYVSGPRGLIFAAVVAP